MSSSIYLSGSEILELAHYAHWIPVSRGITRDYVERTYPGWTFNSLYPPLVASGLLRPRDQSFSRRRLIDGIIGVEINRAGTVTGDDGSSTSPARLESWDRADRRRVSEHLTVSNHFDHPVILHVPHGSRHLPTRCRPEFVVSPSGLKREITASTDQWVSQLANAVGELNEQVLIASATLSRLYFDAERFPVDDQTETFGRGVVYTTTSTGRPLRGPLTDDRVEEYRREQDLYTTSMEHLVRRSLERFDRALIIDLHSYPARPQFFENPDRRRPEICIGTDPSHTPQTLAQLASLRLGDAFEIGVNEPYDGTYVPGSLFGTERRVQSIMVEVRRDVIRTPAARRRLAERLDRMIGEWITSTE